MKILVLTPVYLPPRLDGIRFDTRAVHDLLMPLASNNEIRVVYLYQHPFHEFKRYFSSAWRKRRREGVRYSVDGIDVDLVEIIKRPRQFSVELTNRQVKTIQRTLRKIVLSEKYAPDIVVAHMPTLFCQVLDTPLFAHVTKVGVLHAADRLYAELNGKRKEQFAGFDAVFGRTPSLSRYFIEKGYVGIEQGCAYSGIEVDSYSHAIGVLGERKYAAMYAGKLIGRKNVDLVIESFALAHKDDSSTLLIAGDGAERPRLEELALKKLGRDRCIFTGSVSREAVIDYMAQSDLFVMPSVNETLGLVYLEAMSQGCITLGTIGEGIDGTIIEGVNGFLVRPVVRDLADVLTRINALPGDEITRISSNAIRIAKSLSCEAASRNYFDLISGVWKRRASND